MQLDRIPEVRVRREGHPRWQDADHLEVEVGAEASGAEVLHSAQVRQPEAVADDGHRGSAESVLVGRWQPSVEWRDRHDAKEARGDGRGLQVHRPVGPQQRPVRGAVGGETLEGARLITPISKVRPREVRGAAAVMAFLHVDEAVRLGERQGAEQYAIDHREDGGVGADAERESDDRTEGERGRSPQDPGCKAEIEPEGAESFLAGLGAA
ncbi:MAG: hypothetical protein IPO52_00045 [Gemmatimonadetes bacterium]|nr:hypothetical protein [Gemmatimonadota bacterium]